MSKPALPTIRRPPSSSSYKQIRQRPIEPAVRDDYSDHASFDDEQEQIMDNGMIRILHAGSSIAGTLIGVAMLTPLYATIGTLVWLEAASSRATRRS